MPGALRDAAVASAVLVMAAAVSCSHASGCNLNCILNSHVVTRHDEVNHHITGGIRVY